MLAEAVSAVLYGVVFLSLILIDYVLGHGFVDMFQKIFCKVACFVKRTVREEATLVVLTPENPISLSVLFMEILVLSLTVAFLNKYKQFRSKDRIDELLHESKEALRQTNEFLEKWRLRRINRQVPTEYSYLDEEPQEIKPLKLEVPILHMAIIDALNTSQQCVPRRQCLEEQPTLGTTRSQPERGDAGDTINVTDSTILSVTSLLEDDLDSLAEPPPSEENIVEEAKNIEFRNRYLWDVMEEDANNLED